MIYCFDLDGTLCRTEGTDYEGSRPIEDRIREVNRLYDEGHTVVIDTGRGSSSGKRLFDMTRKQLESWGVRYHRLRVGVKVAADVYVDDRGKSDKDFFGRP